MPITRERHVLDDHRLPERESSVREEVADDGLPEHGDLRRPMRRRFREEASARERPRTDERVGRRDARDGRLPVVVAGDDLRAHRDRRRNGRDARQFGDRQAVVGRQRRGAAAAGARAGLVDAAGQHDDHVAPRLLICCCTEVRAPAPIATVTITAATPITTPSIVSSERALLRTSARSARRKRGFRVSCGTPFVTSVSASDVAVAERDDAFGVGGDVGLVRDEHDRDAAFFVELRKRRMTSCETLRVERAGRFVGEDEARVVDERARDRDALLLSARELVGVMVRALEQMPTIVELCERDRCAAFVLGDAA